MIATWPLIAAVSQTVTRAISQPFVSATPVGTLFFGSIMQGLLNPLVAVPAAPIRPDVNAVMLQSLKPIFARHVATGDPMPPPATSFQRLSRTAGSGWGSI